MGFNVDNDERFLEPDYCLNFAKELVEEKGESGYYADMSAERIALELYAHAELYYYGLCMSDPLVYQNKIYTLSTNDNPGAILGASIVSWIKYYLIENGEVITVNKDESWFRLQIYKKLWKDKTGKAFEEGSLNG